MSLPNLDQLEQDFVNAAYALKEYLGNTSDNLGSFMLQLEASGRVHGELKIVYKIYDNTYGGDNKVESNRIGPGVEELLRRLGYNERHTPLCLPNVQDVAEAAKPKESSLYETSKQDNDTTEQDN